VVIRWSEEKNTTLKRERGVSFEEVEEIINAGSQLDIIPHPVHSHQNILIIRLRGYVHAVPYVEEEDGLFLKTIYPSRDLQKIYGEMV
jgi:uncharacterized DUF497 family protein